MRQTCLCRPHTQVSLQPSHRTQGTRQPCCPQGGPVAPRGPSPPSHSQCPRPEVTIGLLRARDPASWTLVCDPAPRSRAGKGQRAAALLPGLASGPGPPGGSCRRPPLCRARVRPSAWEEVLAITMRGRRPRGRRGLSQTRARPLPHPPPGSLSRPSPFSRVLSCRWAGLPPRRPRWPLGAGGGEGRAGGGEGRAGDRAFCVRACPRGPACEGLRAAPSDSLNSRGSRPQRETGTVTSPPGACGDRKNA